MRNFYMTQISGFTFCYEDFPKQEDGLLWCVDLGKTANYYVTDWDKSKETLAQYIDKRLMKIVDDFVIQTVTVTYKNGTPVLPKSNVELEFWNNLNVKRKESKTQLPLDPWEQIEELIQMKKVEGGE